MSAIAVSAENLAKQYRLAHAPQRYKALRDSLAQLVSRPFATTADAVRRWRRQTEDTPFWALHDVSFQVQQGEVIGIIGRNGAGKSTLLKILSRITQPTSGRARIRGRVGSLLEVGSGFHPELTGRENIYLNGSILGMRKTEIDRKFDEIVAFSETERFLDTPVKHFSSGMYMRLAFAVAAHLEPEILLVDEVLAVGDAAFQRKCLGKMNDVARQGRTVFFVSHNMVAVENLCQRVMLLDKGKLIADGLSAPVIRQYLARADATRPGQKFAPSTRVRSAPRAIELLSYDLIPKSGAAVRAGEGFTIRTYFRSHSRVVQPIFSIGIFTVMGVAVFAIHTSDVDYDIPYIEQDGYIDLHISNPNLLPGRYMLHFAFGDSTDPHCHDHLTDAGELTIETADVYGTGKLRSVGWSLLFFAAEWRLTLGAIHDGQDCSSRSAPNGKIAGCPTSAGHEGDQSASGATHNREDRVARH
jgi:lipopolysaccharide transport system ATP-binding protein